MSELSSDAKNLIEQGRLDDAPGTDDRARIRHRLMSELGAGVFATAAMAAGLPQTLASAPSIPPASAAQSGAVVGRTVRMLWRSSMVKLLAAASVTGALYIGAQGLTHAPRPPAGGPQAHARPSAQPAIPNMAEREPRATAEPPAAQLAKPVPSDPAPIDAPIAGPASAGRLPPRGLRRPLASPAPRPVPSRTASERDGMSSPTAARAEAPPQGSLAAELALLELAQRALRQREPSVALQLAQRHATRFPLGALGEERSGIEALARCQLGDRSHPAVDAFLARAARSPLAARVRKECRRR